MGSTVLGFMVWGLWFRVQGFWSRVWTPRMYSEQEVPDKAHEVWAHVSVALALSSIHRMWRKGVENSVPINNATCHGILGTTSAGSIRDTRYGSLTIDMCSNRPEQRKDVKNYGQSTLTVTSGSDNCISMAARITTKRYKP